MQGQGVSLKYMQFLSTSLRAFGHQRSNQAPLSQNALASLTWQSLRAGSRGQEPGK